MDKIREKNDTQEYEDFWTERDQEFWGNPEMLVYCLTLSVVAINLAYGVWWKEIMLICFHVGVGLLLWWSVTCKKLTFVLKRVLSLLCFCEYRFLSLNQVNIVVRLTMEFEGAFLFAKISRFNKLDFSFHFAISFTANFLSQYFFPQLFLGSINDLIVEVVCIFFYYFLNHQIITLDQRDQVLNNLKLWKTVIEEEERGVIIFTGRIVTYTNNKAQELLQVREKSQCLQKLKQFFNKDFDNINANPKDRDWHHCSPDSVNSIPLECLARCIDSQSSIVFIRKKEIPQSIDPQKMKNNYKKMLLISFSHEFRTPLNGILTILSLLRDKMVDAEDIYQIDAAISSAKSLNNYVNNCLDYMSLEAKEFELKKKVFNLDSFLSDVLEMIMIHANRKGLSINLEKGVDIPELIKTDEARLQQVLLNLLMNSIKHTTKGGVTLKLSQDYPNMNYLRIEVTDTGIGIPREHMVQLFKLFGGSHENAEQMSKETKRAGFGLTICNLLCKQLGSDLSVDSVVDKGTSFMFLVRLEPISSHKGKLQHNPSPSLKNIRHLLPSSKGLNKYRYSLNNSNQSLKGMVFRSIADREYPLEGEDENLEEFKEGKDVKKVHVFLTHEIPPCKSLPNIATMTQQIYNIKALGKKKLPSQFCDNKPTLLKRVHPHQLSPALRDSMNFKELETLSQTDQDTRQLMFVPGRDMIQNKKFLKNHMQDSSITFRKQQGSKEHNSNCNIRLSSFANMNPPCGCPAILIVDDQEINKIALSGMLSRMELIHREASNGKEALEILSQENAPKRCCCGGIRLVFMDYEMPVMNGVEASKEIERKTANGELLPTTVVALTAYGAASIEKQCREAGMKEFLEKPIHRGKLLEVIKRVLSNVSA